MGAPRSAWTHNRWPLTPANLRQATRSLLEGGDRVISMGQRHDVVVVGAGPAGSATAALLAGAGLDVKLVDRAHFPRSKACAEYLTPGATAMLRKLGVLERLTAHAGCSLRGMELCAPSGGRYLVEYRAADEAKRGLAIPRSELDLALLERARARGARVLEGFQAADVLMEQGAVQGVIGRDSAGRTVALRARLLVGADGARSVVANRLGLRRPARWPRRLGLATHLAGVPWRTDYGEMHVGPRGYVGVAPVGKDVVSVGLVRSLPAARLGSAGTALASALADYPELASRLERGQPVEPVRGVGPLACRVRACQGPGYALVGDAAGFLDPFTGEGIFRALRGAEILANGALRSLAGGDDCIQLGRAYELPRRAAFRAKERLTALIQIFVQWPALMDYAVDRLQRRPGPAAHLSLVLGDLAPAEDVIAPAFLWSLLRP
jgi:geranylgeranyl reductase family protein